ncbi:GntR family transcriptional regulator [Streptomyces sp. YC504]|uniref:GntR family transcriptional regulator n=2 Tax=Streptomyces mesophilus TaxID=1775132 RepID=A0A6G4XDM2_9ACTN|nr:GntR family transcriptional regulator [Streptomyces mesophilus]
MTASSERNSFSKGMKSEVVAEALRQRISDEGWGIGTKLPTEPELAESYAVGLNTVRRAVGALVDEGIVVRRQGSGTYVESLPPTPRRRLLGVLVPSTSYYYPQVIEGIERAATAAGAGVILASSENRLALEAEQTRRLLDNGVDGLILVPNLNLADDPQAHVDALHRLPVPYVLVERRPPAPAPDDPTSYVATHHVGGVYAAMRHLTSLGHTRIGYLGRLRTGTAAVITEGYELAAAALGVEPVPEAVVQRVEWSSEEIQAYAAMCRGSGVTAVFCHGDRDAVMLLGHARRLGMRVPQDLAVVAYDDDIAEFGDPALTAVAPPKADIGALAAEFLLQRITKGPEISARRLELQPRLVVRASCGGSDAATETNHRARAVTATT